MGERLIWDLGKVLQAANANQNGPESILIGHLDELINTLFVKLETRKYGEIRNIRAIQFFAFAQSAFRSSIFLNKAGFTGHIAPILRQSMESASYGWFHSVDTDFLVSWKDRENDDFAKKYMRDIDRKIGGKLKIENPDLHSKWKNLRENLVSFGAHPNVLGVDGVMSLKQIAKSGEYQIDFATLTGQESRDKGNALIASTGIMICNLANMIWASDHGNLKLDEIVKKFAC